MYLVRAGGEDEIVYVGMAGARQNRRQRERGGQGWGIPGRLRTYASGTLSGLGEAAFNHALADPNWVAGRLAELEAGSVLTAKLWAAAAVEHQQLSVRWAVTADRASATALERQVIEALRDRPLWNVRR